MVDNNNNNHESDIDEFCLCTNLTFGLTLQRRCLGDGAQCLHGLVGEVPSL